jgi:hypothetical protein
MPAKDIYHECAKNALTKDGWTITDDSFTLKWGKREMYVDLGAEKLLAAKKLNCKIAVEVKSFIGPSPVKDMRDALGQFVFYSDILARTEPERTLYLAIRKATFHNLFEEDIGVILLENQRIRLIVFDQETEVIVKWIP